MRQKLEKIREWIGLKLICFSLHVVVFLLLFDLIDLKEVLKLVDQILKKKDNDFLDHAPTNG